MYDVLIVGAGPAGISTAAEAKHAGIHRILLLERAPSHSYTIQRLYVGGKRVDTAWRGVRAHCEGLLCILPGTRETVLATLEAFVQRYDLDIRYNQEVQRITRTSDGFETWTPEGLSYRSRVVVIAVGIFGRPNRPDYAIPPGLRGRVHFEVASRPIRGPDVLVVGGGDSAAEYVQHLYPANQVILSYRRSALTRLNPVNLEIVIRLAEERRMEMVLGTNILRLEDDRGRPRAVFAEIPARTFDSIVYALGGSAPLDFLRRAGIQVDESEPVVKPNYQTNVPGLYLAGDLVAQGKGSIILAFNTGRRVVRDGLCVDHFQCSIDDGPTVPQAS
jgi:thioredoxin reductase (NADPH)